MSTENPKEDVITKIEEGEEKKDSDCEPKPVMIEKVGNEGYLTPTSEEHIIPESSTATSPPPAPKKRKRIFLHKKKLPKLELFENTDPEANEEVESFFQSFNGDDTSRVQTEPDLHNSTKKPRLDP